MNEVEGAANDLMVAIRGKFESDALAEENGAEIMRVARLISRAEGFPPDYVCMGHPEQPHQFGPRGTCGIYLPMQPNWAVYWDQAKAALAAEKGAADAPKA